MARGWSGEETMPWEVHGTFGRLSGHATEESARARAKEVHERDGILTRVVATGVKSGVCHECKAKDAPRVTELRRIHLTRDGYATGKWGSYYGVGPPVFSYEVEWPNGDHKSGEFRASDRAAARAHLAKLYPGSKIVR